MLIKQVANKMSMTRFTDEENKIMNSLFILVMAIYGAFDNGGRGKVLFNI